ncbi:alpha/beta hydrolase family protein [Nocardia sp. NPDC058705]|uniref:alpha/beta hydrolase family protein n=1 Tax=Nocardia sp. NPDC058705 TaxID=3346609 RepID=UPI003679E0B6
MSITTEPRAHSGVRRAWQLLAVALGLVLLGGATAAFVQTDGGNVSIRDTRFIGADGAMLSGLIYVPDHASAADPAPGVLLVHGYINSRETQAPTAIELARHGYVVLALDQTGHGASDAPAFAQGYGGPAALEYLRSLDIVDRDNIGLAGHSMGGWTILQAAEAFPDGYRSMVIAGSATAPAKPSTAAAPRTPEGTPGFPRNMALIYGVWEEFSRTMWFTGNPRDVMGTDQMKKLFGTTETVQQDQLYGSIEAGTARVLHRPLNTHPGLTHDPRVIAQTVDWFDQTLDGATPARGQIWWIKELATLVAMIGGLLAVFAAARLLLETRFFAVLRADPGTAHNATGPSWFVGAALATAIPALTFLPIMKYAGKALPPTRFFPQAVSNWIVAWALANALLTVVLLSLWYLRRRRTTTLRELGVAPAHGLSTIGRSAALGFAAVSVMIGLVVFSDLVFKTDFRFWILGFRAPTALQLSAMVVYLIPLIVFFLALSALLNTQQRVTGKPVKAYAAAALTPALGVLLLIVIDYVPMLLGGGLLFYNFPLHIIIAYQIVPLVAIAGLLCVALYRWTGSIYPGAFAAALLISWALTAGTATQFPLGEWDGLPSLMRIMLPALCGVTLIAVAIRARRKPEPATQS